MNKQWWKESVVYQIYPRSFKDSNGDGIGDLPGIISKLDYLKELGIDILWLSPIYKSPKVDNGYDISDYQNILEEYGTMEDLDELLKQVHQRGMKLVMDLVVNHTSDEHDWFIESQKSKENPYRDYYIWRTGKEGREPTNWSSNFGGPAWTYNENTDEYYLHLFSKKQPDLNWNNKKLRKEIYKMMTWWLDKGIDGFRMDVINFISKPDKLKDVAPKPGQVYASGSKHYMNGPRIHEFLQEMNQKVLSHYNVMTVGEMPGVTPELAQLYTGEKRNELNMVFQFEHMGLDSGPNGKWDLKPLDLFDLKENLSKWQNALEKVGWNSLYFNNHDQPRSVSRFGDTRNYHEKSAKMLATLLHMMKGTPFVYQGEEIGMTNIHFASINDYKDIETLNFYNEQKDKNIPEANIMESIYAKSRDNARTPMQWDSSENAGFTTAIPWIKINKNAKAINVEDNINDENSIFHYYQSLIALRKQYDIIQYGSYQLIKKDHPEIFSYMRELNDEVLLVICNFGETQPEFHLPDQFNEKTSELLLGNYSLGENKIVTPFTLSPYEARVYLMK